MKKWKFWFSGICFIIVIFVACFCYYKDYKQQNIDNATTTPDEDGTEYIVSTEPFQNLPFDNSKHNHSGFYRYEA